MILNMTGGGAPLNFKVVGNPQPASPKENTIWVNTDVPIGKWYFDASQPDDLLEGDVWFPIGTSSPVEFNALKKNGIQVYPISAKQYVGGAWVDVEAKSYQGGEWVGWYTSIVKNGDILIGFSGNLRKDHNSTMTKVDNYLRLVIGDSRAGGPTTSSKIDVTSIKTIYLDVDVQNVASGGVSVGIFSAINADRGTAIQSNTVAHQKTQLTGRQLLKCDVSNYSGLYYIGVFSDDTSVSGSYTREYHIYSLYYI